MLCRCFNYATFNRMVTQAGTSITTNSFMGSQDKRSISYRAGKRDPNSIFPLNYKKNNDYHSQIAATKCDEMDCYQKICQQMCSQFDQENSVAHLTHNPNTPVSEFNDKYPMWLDSHDYKGKAIDQIAMIYENPPKTAPTEITTDVNITNYINQSHIIEPLHNEVKDKIM